MSGDILSILAFVLTVVMLVAALLVLTLKNLIGAVAVSGVVSLGAAILFVMLRAPDVAMTEAAVGAGLSGVVLALGLRRLGLWRLEGDDGRVHPLTPTIDEPGVETANQSAKAISASSNSASRDQTSSDQTSADQPGDRDA